MSSAHQTTLGAALATFLAAGLAGCSPDAPAMPDAPDAQVARLARAFTSFDVPGAIITYAIDINDSGAIVGRFTDSDGMDHGFLRDKTGTIETIDFPGAVFTAAAAINNSGDVVGFYALPDAPDDRHGYLRRHGRFTTIDPPGSTFTNVLGINEGGDMTGRYFTDDGGPHGFLFRKGRFTTFDVPGADATNEWKINARGTIVGQFVDGYGFGHLFTSTWSGTTPIPLPHGYSVDDHNGGINSRGDLVGTYCDDASSCGSTLDGHHGFLIRGRTFRTVDIPGATTTFAFGINDRGQIVGGYADAQGMFHAFLLDP
ncbi:MAG TPA: hypothetical protein VLT17_14190 [Gemmatimonadales bacterium]|nr:hypothetical protein [Gemmatimonadales bacterium]